MGSLVCANVVLPGNSRCGGKPSGYCICRHWSCRYDFTIYCGNDRRSFFATQKVFGFLHLLSGIFLYLVGQASDWGEFYPYLLLHLICYMPTLALSNSLCFQNMEDPQRQFPPIRTLGTIGWIASGILVGSSFFFENEFHSIWPAFLGGAIPPSDWTSISMTSQPFMIGSGFPFYWAYILLHFQTPLPN